MASHYRKRVTGRAGFATLRKIMLVSTSALIAPSLGGVAHAQDAANTSASAGDQDILVQGYRASIEESLRQKRDAVAIVEVITAEDISKFPDKNVADALQRVPGVVIERSGGEGKTVSVRGLQPDLTLTLLNGNYVASSETNNEATRSFNYVLLPSNMLSSAELFKTPEARIDEGGIGGTVILHTRRPLDLPSLSGFVSAEGTYADTTKKVDPQLSGMLSWHNEAENFGLLVGATWQRRTNRSMEVSTEDWRWYSDNNDQDAVDVNGHALDPQPTKWWGGTGFNDQNHPYTGPVGADGVPTGPSYYHDFFMPTAVDFGIRDEKRERLGIQATAQLRPAENLTLTANYFRFDLSGDYTLNMLKIPEWNLARIRWDGNWPGGRLLNGLTFDPSKTVATGAEYELKSGKAYFCNDDQAVAGGQRSGGWGPDDCTVPTPQLTGGYSREKALSQTADFAADWDGDLWKASFKAGRTWSSGGPSMNFRMSAKPRRFVNGAWQAGNRFSAWDLTGTPSMTFSPNLQDQILAGIAEIDTGSTDSSWKETRISQNYAQADVTKLFDDSLLQSIQFGAKYRDGKVHRNTGNTVWYCQGTTMRYQQGCDTQASIAQPGFFLSKPITNIPGGFKANVFPGINFPAYLDYLDNRFGGSVRFEEPDFIYNVREKIWSGYVQTNFKTDNFRGNLGLRVAHTKQHAESTDAVEKFLDYFVDGPDGKPLLCADPTASNCESGFVKNEVKQKTFELNTLDKTYTDFLPSLNLAYDVTSDIVLRGAVSKVIARPAFTDVAFPGSLNFISEEYSSDRAAAGGSSNPGWYGSGSNKDLKPFQAWQYDLGLEWYFHRGSVLGVGLFRKDVKNFVVPVSRDQQVTIGGETVTVQGFSTSANGRDGVSQGIELYAQHTFDFGLGFQANYTYNDTNLAAVVLDGEEIGKSPLVGSAKNQANFTIFYEKGPLLARASYNRRGEVVSGMHNNNTIYLEPYQQIDLNVAYNFTDRLTLTGSVLNLTKEEQRAHLGNDTKARLWTNNYSGRIMYMGLTYKF
jgi:TonB-dependent receptor